MKSQQVSARAEFCLKPQASSILTIDKDTCNSVEHFGIKLEVLSKSYTILLTHHGHPSHTINCVTGGDLRSHQHHCQYIDKYNIINSVCVT